MTVKEASKKLEISVSLCYQLVAEGRMPHVRIGALGRRGKIIIRDEHLATFLEDVKASTQEQ